VATVNILTTHIAGDIGGAGICRLHFTNGGATIATSSDANTAAASMFDMWNGAKALFPNNINFTCDPIVQAVEESTGGLQAEVAITTVPGQIFGTTSFDYAAGVGARGYWHTNTVKGRRLVRGATFFVPLTASAFTSGGQVAGGTITTLIAAMGDYAGALVSGSLQGVIWSRPTPANPSGGLAAPIAAWSVSTVPAGLRTRRS